MLNIDNRLKEAEGEMNLTENFNRVLGISDKLAKKIERLNPLVVVDVKAETGTTKVFGELTSKFQTSVAVANGKITGNLAYVSTGTVATDWGAGNFLVLKFDNLDDAVTAGATSVKVGLDPSAGSGLVEILGDPDGNGIFKIANKDEQKFVVESTDGIFSRRQEFDLSELVCATE